MSKTIDLFMAGQYFLIFLGANLFLYPSNTCLAQSENSVITKEHFISEEDTKKELARTWANSKDSWEQANDLYLQLITESPKDLGLRREFAIVLKNQEKYLEAAEQLTPLVLQNPKDVDSLKLLGHLHLLSRNFPLASKTFERVLVQQTDSKKTEKRETLAILARSYFWGGSHKKALKAFEDLITQYKELISKEDWREHGEVLMALKRPEKALDSFRVAYKMDPKDVLSKKRYAFALAWNQKTAEAQKLLEELILENPQDLEIVLELAYLEAQAGHAEQATQLFEKFFQSKPLASQIGIRYADYLQSWGDFYKAEKIYLSYLEEKPNVEVMQKLARLYISTEREQLARKIILAAFKTHPGKRELLLEFKNQHQLESTKTLEEITETIEALEQKISKDSQNISARIELAELLAAIRKYHDAIKIFKELKEVFPGNRKIVLGLARTLSWSRQYQESIDEYKFLGTQAPNQDPALVRERARVEYWKKSISDAQRSYQEAYLDPIDKQIYRKLKELQSHSQDPIYKDLVQKFENEQSDIPYFHYQSIYKSLCQDRDPAPMELLELVLELHPEYLIQAGSYLENAAKTELWKKRYLLSLNYFEKLTEIEPQNQEARFDHAQALCSSGLHAKTEKIYQDLLKVSPLHSRARLALSNEYARRKPALAAKAEYWQEKGRGDLSNIERYLFQADLQIPLLQRSYNLNVGGQKSWESPFRGNGEVESNSFILSGNGRPNNQFEGGFSWQHKDYQDNFESSDTGSIWGSYIHKDHFRLKASLNRSNVIQNLAGIQRDIQVNEYQLQARGKLSRELELGILAAHLKYDDDNQMDKFQTSVDYLVSDHPRELKLSFIGEYRNTDEESVFLGSGQGFSDFLHPYWTPKDYFSANLLIDWRHELSDNFFCGTSLNYYELKLLLKQDTENNPGIQFEAKWYREFNKQLAVLAEVMLHESDLWDALFFTLRAEYKFAL